MFFNQFRNLQLQSFRELATGDGFKLVEEILINFSCGFSGLIKLILKNN
jgi:hypothetical protein